MKSAANPYVVVVGVDYSDASRLAFREALWAASQRGEAEVHAVHVTSLLVKHHRAGEKRLSSDTEALTRARRRLERFVSDELAAFAKQVPPHGTSSRVVAHVRRRAPGPEIAQLAADLAADLVVVGTQGNDEAAHLLLGSVAHQVVGLSPCAVLIVRPKKIVRQPPSVEAPCARCVQVRKRSSRQQWWCEMHQARQGQRRDYERPEAQREAPDDRAKRRAVERWENEGGASVQAPTGGASARKARKQ